jgi:hypothetical protein
MSVEVPRPFRFWRFRTVVWCRRARAQRVSPLLRTTFWVALGAGLGAGFGSGFGVGLGVGAGSPGATGAGGVTGTTRVDGVVPFPTAAAVTGRAAAGFGG